MQDLNRPVTVFISYSREGAEHEIWVRSFAARLRQDGVDALLDLWEIVPGEALPQFMERSVRDSDYVVVICTPTYKAKADGRKGGVGYEGDIMTSELFVNAERRKFIPVLREGPWAAAAPSWMLGSYYIDLSANPFSSAAYEDLLRTLLNTREQAPTLGAKQSSRPAASDSGGPASRIVVEVAAMSFVDLMRLSYVSTSKLAFEHNVARYGEFVEVAALHCEDFTNQLARFAPTLSEDLITRGTKIERTFAWARQRLHLAPARPREQLTLFSTMRDVSDDLHALGMGSHPRYSDEWKVVGDEISRLSGRLSARTDVDDLFRIRLETQSAILRKRPKRPTAIATIADDAFYDLGLVYFCVDRHLLAYVGGE
jgi:hypothetical protein